MIPPSLTAVTSWLQGALRAVMEHADGFSVVDDEVTLDVRDLGGKWVVSKTWRDKDRGVVFEAPSTGDVDRYLTLAFANDKRNARGLRPLGHLITIGDAGNALPVDGFTLTGDLDHGFLLTDTATRRAWRFASDVEAARFSGYVDVPVERLRSGVDQVSRDLLDGDGRGASWARFRGDRPEVALLSTPVSRPLPAMAPSRSRRPAPNRSLCSPSRADCTRRTNG